MSSTHYTPAPLQFDEDAPPRRPPSLAPRVWAGALLLVAALGLILMGGCFLIGALVMVDPAILNTSPGPGPQPAPSWDPAGVYLFTTLNVLCGVCFVGAAILFVVGLVGLCRILFGAAKEAA
jgi:hypothetical protein